MLFKWDHTVFDTKIDLDGCIGVRANIHLGGQTEFCPNRFGGGGGSSRSFPGSQFSGGGSIAEILRARFGGGVVPLVAEFFPLTAVTDPQFVLFKHVLCFARIMSTLCPNVCRQTAPCPTVPYAYGWMYLGTFFTQNCYF